MDWVGVLAEAVHIFVNNKISGLAAVVERELSGHRHVPEMSITRFVSGHFWDICGTSGTFGILFRDKCLFLLK